MCYYLILSLQDVNYLYDMFYVRKNLHQRAYQHKTGNAIEHMYVCVGGVECVWGVSVLGGECVGG